MTSDEPAESNEKFEKVLAFLKQYSWIFTSSNTNILKENVLDTIPIPWIEYLKSLNLQELNDFPVHTYSSYKQPESLQQYCKTVSSLKVHHRDVLSQEKDIYFKKMSPKKLHEISRLSHLIQSECGEDEILVDFGSGLGYLSEILYKRRKCKILGLECDSERVQMALNRQSKYYPESKGDITYKTELISEESSTHIEEYIKEISTKDNPISIIGLHSCADLTVTSIKLFLEMKRVKNLVIMPCCYHKLRLKSEDNHAHFENFPLSKRLKDLYKGEDFLNRPFLRLACQETASRWSVMSEEDHTTHGRNMFQRAALEILLKEGESFKKNKNCSPKIEESYDIKCENLEKLKSEYKMLLQRFGGSEFPAEVLTCLQASMQSICEDLVLNDRICYVKEKAEEMGISVEVCFKRVVNDSLSPRCFALVAKKVG